VDLIEYDAKVQIDLLKSNEENPKHQYDNCNEVKKCLKQDYIRAMNKVLRRYYCILIDVTASLTKCSLIGKTVSIST
jgi:hypothetical protein